MHSFVFVRNPLERLVSIYFEKIAKNPVEPWKTLGQKIISDYRKSKDTFHDPIPR